MKVLVAVKQVARLGEDFVLDATGTVPAGALDWRRNEWDAFSLEAALALGDGEQDDLIVVTVGAEQAEESLRAGLAIGADRAVRVWDDALAIGLAGGDALAVARVLAALAESERPDLILCGAQSSDAANAATGVALAGLLDLPHVAVVSAIERDGERLTVERELEGGASEILRLELPALLTVQTGANRPRRANLRAIKQARAQPISLLSLSDLALDAATVLASAGSRTVRLRERERSASASAIEGAPAEIAARITTIVERALSG